MNTSPQEFFANPEDGVNCQLLAISLTLARGYSIDTKYRSSEVYEDLTYTDAIFDRKIIQTGDILGLTTSENKDPKRLHLGIAYKDDDGVLYLVHSSREIGETTVSALESIQKQEKYINLACIKRPKILLPTNPHNNDLERLGFGFLKNEQINL